MKTRLAGLFIGLNIALSLVASPSAVAAAGGGTYCGYRADGPGRLVSYPGYYFLVIFRDANYSGQCMGRNSSVPDLTKWVDGGGRNFNDVTSSWKFVLTGSDASHYRAQFFYNVNYDQDFSDPNIVLPQTGGGLPVYENDAMSSFLIWYQ